MQNKYIKQLKKNDMEIKICNDVVSISYKFNRVWKLK